MCLKLSLPPYNDYLQHHDHTTKTTIGVQRRPHRTTTIMPRATVILVWMVLLAGGNPLWALPLRDHSGVIFGSDFLRILDPRIEARSGDDLSDGPRAGAMVTPELPAAAAEDDPSKLTEETRTFIDAPDDQPVRGNSMLNSRHLRKLDPFLASSVPQSSSSSSSLPERQKLHSRKMPEDTAVTNHLQLRRKFAASSSSSVKPTASLANALAEGRGGNDRSRVTSLTATNGPENDFLIPYDEFDYSNYYYLDDLYPLASSAVDGIGTTATATVMGTTTRTSSQRSTIAMSRLDTSRVKTRGSSTISSTSTIPSPVSSRRTQKETTVRSRETTFTTIAATPTTTRTTPMITATPETTPRTTTTKRTTTKRSTFRYQTTTDSTPKITTSTTSRPAVENRKPSTAKPAVESESRKPSTEKDTSSTSTPANQRSSESTTTTEKSIIIPSFNTPKPRTSTTVRTSTQSSEPLPTPSPLTREKNTTTLGTTKSPPINATHSPVSQVNGSAQRPQVPRNNQRHFRYTTPIPKPKKDDVGNTTTTPRPVPNENTPEKGPVPNENTPEKEPVPNENTPEKEPVPNENTPEKGPVRNENTPEKEPVPNENTPEKSVGSTSSSSVVVEVRVESPGRDPRVLPAAEASPRVQTVDRGPKKVTPAPPSRTVHTVLPDRHTTSFLLNDPLVVDVAVGPTTSSQDPETMPARPRPSALLRGRSSSSSSTVSTMTTTTTTEDPVTTTTTTGAPSTISPPPQDLPSSKEAQGTQVNRGKNRSVQFQTSVVEVSESVGSDSHTLTKGTTKDSQQESQPISQSGDEGASDTLNQKQPEEFQSQRVSTSVSRTEAHTAERVSSVSIYERLPKQATSTESASITTPQPSNVTDSGVVATLTNNTAPRGRSLPVGLPKAQQGLAPLGLAPFGEAPEGLAPFGHAPEGVAPYGSVPSGLNPHGLAPQGRIPEGVEFSDTNTTANATESGGKGIKFVDATVTGGADANSTVGYVVEEHNVSRFRLEEKTPDGFIIGEYGVVDHNTGDVNGVRYTADSTADPHLIYETLMKFLEL